MTKNFSEKRRHPRMPVISNLIEPVNLHYKTEDGKETSLVAILADLSASGMRMISFLGAPLAHTHVFSHLEWHMAAYAVYSNEDAARLTLPADESAEADFARLFYADRHEIESQYSLPSAFRWALDCLSPAGSADGVTNI